MKILDYLSSTVSFYFMLKFLLIFFVAFSSQANYLYDCQWTMKLLGVPSVKSFQFQLKANNASWVIEGDTSVNLLNRTLSFTPFGKNLRIELADRFIPGQTWDVFKPGEEIQFSNEVDSFLVCTLQDNQ